MRTCALAFSLAATGLVLGGCSGLATHSYRIPSSSMEPTLHCAKPAVGCRGSADDHVLVQVGNPVKRGDIVVFNTPRQAMTACGEGGTFVKRIVGLPGETVRVGDRGFISVDGKRLSQPYISARTRTLDSYHFHRQWKVPPGDYFVIGDNMPESCDSRAWGGVPRGNIIGPVVKIVR